MARPFAGGTDRRSSILSLAEPPPTMMVVNGGSSSSSGIGGGSILELQMRTNFDLFQKVLSRGKEVRELVGDQDIDMLKILNVRQKPGGKSVATPPAATATAVTTTKNLQGGGGTAKGAKSNKVVVDGGGKPHPPPLHLPPTPTLTPNYMGSARVLMSKLRLGRGGHVNAIEFRWLARRMITFVRHAVHRPEAHPSTVQILDLLYLYLEKGNEHCAPPPPTLYPPPSTASPSSNSNSNSSSIQGEGGVAEVREEPALILNDCGMTQVRRRLQ